MYSPLIISRNLDLASAEIRKRHPELPSGWELTHSTQGEIEDMVAHFDSLLDDRGNLTRELTWEEQMWVLQETTLCKLDFLYFGSRYGKVETEESRVTGFAPRLAQQIVLEEFLAPMEEQHVALMLMFLKARQLGITLLWQLLIAHRTFFWPNVNTLTGSAVEAKSRKMVGKLEFLWERLPWWLRPRMTSHKVGEKMEFGDLNSGIYVQWGNQKSGIGRGDTPSVSHLSEVASFENPDELIDSALVRAQHENPFSLLGFESTAERTGDWWHKTWDFNKRMDRQGLARLKPVFLPWFVGVELYPKQAFLRRRPIPLDWQVPEHIERHARACETYVEATPYLSKHLGSDWRLPIEQKWFYYLDHLEHKEKGELHLFLREMPATPDEAFQNANPSVFPIEVISRVRDEAQQARPLGVFEVRGREISGEYLLGVPTTGNPRIVRCLDKGGRQAGLFELWPLVEEGWPDADPEGKLFVWEWPKMGEEYGIGIDPSEGVDQDWSVITVVKRATPEHPDVQVAEWASRQVGPHDLWAWAWCLGHVYTTQRRQGGWREPRIVVETNIAAGDAVQAELLKRGWGTFHQQMDLTKLGSRGKGRGPKARLDAIGWRTTRANRPKLISLARKMVRDGTFQVKSPWLAKSLSDLEYNVDKARIEATQGKHDDHFFAAGLILTSWYDPEIYGSLPSAWKGERDWQAALKVRPRYNGGEVIGGAARGMGPKVAKVDGRSVVYGGLK